MNNVRFLKRRPKFTNSKLMRKQKGVVSYATHAKYDSAMQNMIAMSLTVRH